MALKPQGEVSIKKTFRAIVTQLIFAFFAAPGLLHYWIDGHIWKVRSEPTLRDYLKLTRR
jgi:hypothetical protein